MAKKIIDNFILNNSYMKDKGLLWDCLKCDFRGQTVSYSSALARERRKQKKSLWTKFLSLNLIWMNSVLMNTILISLS